MVSPMYHTGQSISFFSLFGVLRVFSIIAFSSQREIHAIESGDELFCPSDAGVDLTYAVSNTSGFIHPESGYFFPEDTVRFRNGAWLGCICDIKSCLALCPNVTINGSSGIADDSANYSIPNVYNANLTVDDDEETLAPEERFHFIIWDPCEGHSAYFLEPEMYKTDEYYLLDNGTIFLPAQGNRPEEQFKDFKKYCLRQRGNDSRYTPRVCVPNAQTDDFVTVKYVGALLAVPFLIATVVVYSVLSELRNIHGTTLRCYLCCLVVTYVALAADRIPAPDYDAGMLCMVLGFVIYFSFIASFFWLNVMCIDMWWRLGGFGSLRSSGRMHDRKKFIGYSIYAWGFSVLLTAFCILMEFTPGISDSWIRPGFKMKSCWFSTKTAAALYFFGPVGLIIACNICLFISTSIKIVQHRRQTQRQLNSGESRRHDENEQWFSLHLKLSVIMGISWSTEVISWLWEGPKYIWYFTDMINALQGFLIFLIFVWKKRIWQSLKKQYKGLKFTRKGCFFTPPSLDSPATTNCSEDSAVRCNVGVLAMEEIKNPQNQNPIQNSGEQAANDSR